MKMSKNSKRLLDTYKLAEAAKRKEALKAQRSLANYACARLDDAYNSSGRKQSVQLAMDNSIALSQWMLDDASDGDIRLLQDELVPMITEVFSGGDPISQFHRMLNEAFVERGWLIRVNRPGYPWTFYSINY